MIALSYTRFKDAACPHRFNALHVAKTFKEPETEPMRVGKAVAMLLETYRRECIRKKIPSDLDFLRSLAKKASPRVQELVDVFQSSPLVEVPVDVDWIRPEAKYSFNANLHRILGKDAWFDKDTAWRTVADLAYIQGDTLYVVDDKTGRSDPDPFQVETYGYFLPKAMATAYKDRVKKVSLVYNELGKGFVQTVGEYAVGELDFVHDTVKEALALVNALTEFPAHACDRCKWCRIPDCPLKAETEKTVLAADQAPVQKIPVEIQTQEDAQKAVQFLLFAEGITDQVKDSLKSFVQANGPVSSAGKKAEFRPNTPWKCSEVQPLVQKLMDLGVPVASIGGVLSMSETNIKKLLKSSGLADQVLAVLETHGVRKEYAPRFGLYAA